MSQLTVLDLSARPASPSDYSSRVAPLRRLRPGRARSVLAIAAVAFSPVVSHAQTNAAPVVTAPGDKTYEQGETINPFAITVSDADGDTTTVTVSGLPSGLSYANGQVQGTVSSSAAAQAHTVTISADDGVNAAVTATFTITVTEAQAEEPAVSDPPNAAPVITSPGDKTYEQGETIAAFAITVSDADGDTITVTLSGLPSGLSYANGQVQGTVASSAAAQAHTVTIRADDGVNAAVEATFTITVTEAQAEEPVVSDPPNAAPVITSPGDKTYEQGETINPFAITVSDADGDMTTVTVSGLPSGLSYANGQVQGTVSSSAPAQAHTATISADDGVNAAVTATFTITVTEAQAEEPAVSDPPNAAPVITSPGDKTYEQGETIAAFAITVSDADGDTTTVTLSGLPSGLSYANGQVQGTVASSAAAQAHTVTIRADDGVNAAVEATFTITVTEAQAEEPVVSDPPNSAPVITSPGDKAYEQGETITPFGITVADADGDAVTVTLTGLPSGLTYANAGSGITGLRAGGRRLTVPGLLSGLSASNGQVQGTVSTSAAAQAYTVTISADDGVNAAVTATFTITVTEEEEPVVSDPPNAAPVITSPGDKAYEQGETITPFGITVADADGDAVTVTLTGLPSGLTYANAGSGITGLRAGGRRLTVPGLLSGLSASNGQVQGTVSTSAAAQAYTVTISADDGVNAAVTATFTITVTEEEEEEEEAAAAAEEEEEEIASNSPPVITGPGNKRYTRGETITAFGIAVSDADGDSVTVTVTGLPSGLSYTNAQVQGTVAGDAVAGDHTVTIQADDGSNAVAETFTITVTAGRAKKDQDQTRPTVTITSCPTGTQTGAFTIGIDFSELVTGFDKTDVTVGNGRVFAFAEGLGDVTTASVIIDPAATGTVTIDVAANVAVDAGNNGNTAAQQCSVDVRLTPSVTIADASASEGNAITFTVTLSRAVSGGLTVTPSFSNGGLTTQGWAVQGMDYTANTAPLRFAGTAGEKKTFTVATTEDTDIEANERFNVSLTVSGTSVTVTATDTATGTILNDDECAKCWWKIEVTGGTQYTAQTLGAEEGETVELTLTQRVDGQRTLTYSTVQLANHNGSADPATGHVDYKHIPSILITSFLTFSGNGDKKTIRIPTYEDTLVERDEYFRLNLTSKYQNVGYADNRLIYIKNDDQATIAVSDAKIGESGWMEFTATLDKALSASATVTPRFTHGTATGDDYTANTQPITFAGTAGEKKKFRVDTTQDSIVEGTETFTAGLAVARSLPHWNYTGAGDAIAVVAGTGTIRDDDAATVSIANASANEGSPFTFTVTLDKTVPGGLTVTPSFADVTATKGTDYTENTAALTFAGAADESQTFTVATTDDTRLESDETFTVGLTVSGTSETVATSSATATIVDDERPPAVTIDDANGSEGGAMTFTVTLDKPVSGGLTVTPSFTDVTATKGTDYSENTAALTFAGTEGETQTIRVLITDDSDSEAPEETFTVSLNVSGTSESVTATDTGTGTIFDDEPPDNSIAPEVTIADSSAEEGETLTFTVTLDYPVSGGLTVTPSFTDVTATKGTDYTENTAALTFAGTAGETQSFTVATTEDTDAELDETFTIGLTVSGTLENVKTTDTATGTITNDDGVPAAVTIADASAAEGDSLAFTVTLDKAVTGGLTVTPSFTDGTASKSADYTENTAGLTFAGTAGEKQTFTVATTEDAGIETDETFTVGLTVSGTSTTVKATDTAKGTIIDDDAGPAVTIADASAAEGDSLTFTVTLDKAVSGGLTVTPSFTDGTATKGTDYTENTAAITFTGTAGETQTFTVATTADADAEHETFTVGLTVSATPTVVAATDTATGTIIDDDGAAVLIADAWASEGNQSIFAVVLSKAVSGGLTVTPSFTDGTATKGTDYTENTAAITFTGTKNETHLVTVATTEDAVVEPDETFTVGLSISGTAEKVAATARATGTIIDDDGAPAVTIADASADEGDRLAFTVTLDKAVWGGFTVTPSFTDVTATKGADYTANTAPITFIGTRGETQSFTVATTEDADVENDETFTVDLTVSGTQTTVTATDTATGTITDDDGALPAVTVADASAAEGDSLTFTVTLDKAVTGGLTVTPRFTDGTAKKGTDYAENTAALTFTGTAGETRAFTVRTTEDTVDEPDEIFTVGLAVSGTQATVRATDTATGTIVDDDSSTLTIDDAFVREGGQIQLTLTLDKAVPGGLTVTPSFTDVTATKGVDYTENTTPILFEGSAGEQQTLPVDTTHDDYSEADETFTVRLSVSGTSATVRATDTATGMIDDDDLPAKVTIDDASAEEGDSITFTVELNQAAETGFTVTPSFTDGTATKGTDYAENTAAIAFAGKAGETKTFTVATTEDDEEEDDETFTISLVVSGSEAVTSTSPATGTITDDDGDGSQGVVPSLTIDDASAAEGEALTFTVTLDEALDDPLTVTPILTDGTATKGTDYADPAATLTFDRGQAGQTRTFTVATTEDADKEGDETFIVSLTPVDTAQLHHGAAPGVSGLTSTSGTWLAPTVTMTDTATGTILDDDNDDDDNDDGDNDDGDNDDGDNDDGDNDDGDNDDGNNGGGNNGNGGTRARVTVADTAAVEGDALSFTVTLDRAVPGGLTVTPALTDETAKSGEDYRAGTRALRFAGSAGEMRTFSVPTVEDAVEEDAETFLVSLTVSATSATVTATDTARGRIVDDDLTPVMLQAEPARISETAGPTAVTVTAALKGGATLSQATAVNVTVGAATDAAAAGADYTATPASFTVTIPAGSARGSSTFTLDPEDDTLMEPDEVLTVAGAAGSRRVTGTSVTLEDDDTAAAELAVRLEPDSVSESAGPTQVTVVAEVIGATPTMPLAVAMRVGDHEDTARLTVDYEAVDAFTVTIPAGETEHRATFVLTPIEDDLLEGNETLTVTGREWRLGAASDEGMIRDEELAEARSEGTGRTLFLLARAIGSESLAALEERFSGAGLGRARLGALPPVGQGALGGWGGPFAGAGMPGAVPGGPAVAGVGTGGPFGGAAGSSPAFGPGAFGMGLGMSAQQPFEDLAWLDGAGFATPLAGNGTQTSTPDGEETGDPAGWVVWGRAATTRTAVQATPGAQARGDLFTVHLGLDTRVGSRLLVGVAASHSRGKLGYTLGGQADAPAAVDGDLTSAQPYVQWTPRPGLEVWGFGGAGRGALQVVDTFGTVDTGLGMRMGAGGARQEVTPGSGLAVKADVFHVAVASDATLDLPEARATATRARMLLEWESEWAPSPSARVRPRLEVGGRWDGGSDVDGFGSEVGGGIALAHLGLGLELSGSGRYLLAHQAEGFEEWGASLALRAGPGVTRRGAWVSVEPEWGAAASRMHAMWGQQPDPGLHPGAALGGALGAEPARLRLAAGYALPEAGTDLRVEATRETYDPQSGPSVGVRFAAQIGW